jgi:murein DD-endopeptidase MepM/ murein hydrolase activator NlpD
VPPVSAFAVTEARVSPERARFGGRPVTLRLVFRAAAPLDLRVVIRRAGRTVRRWELAGAAPGVPQRLHWTGLTSAGRPARDGRYRVRAGPVGRLRAAGSFVLRGHVYPVRGGHWFRGPVGSFGAARNGGRTHEGFDINAACGTPVVAARAGRVVRSRYDAVLYGNQVIIRGRGERRDYWYAHLRAPARVSEGERVRTGARIGAVGATGNAVTVGCHLHFELRGPRGPFDPEPRLRLWDGWS